MQADVTRFAGRLVPARGDIAADSLRGRVTADRYVAGRAMQVTATLLDLACTPGGERATQLIHGERFTVYETRADGLAWGQAARDGYVGYVAAAGLGPALGRGRTVTAIWSQVYALPSVRATVQRDLPYLAEVPVTGSSAGFARLRGGGHVPLPHIGTAGSDPVAEAERFVGVPYLWGGRSARGIDCSGLVQLAMQGTGREAPRDSDMQAALLGVPLARQATLRRGDLVFWKGHVGMMRDAGTLLHANGFHMAVASEPLAGAVARIAAAGGGPVTGCRRP